MAFIDDDEVPSAGWLSELLGALELYEADVGVGPVFSAFPDGTPETITSSPFFQRPLYETGTRLPHAGGGNLLIRKSAFEGFDGPFLGSFGRTGGADAMLFSAMTRAGRILVACREAEVTEMVEGDRLNATVREVDSFRELRVTERSFALVSADNPMSIYGDGYIEHFDIFPGIFRILEPTAVLTFPIIPSVSRMTRRRFSYLFSPAQLQRGAAFYSTEHPEDVSIDQMARSYSDEALRAGHQIDWWFSFRRTLVIHQFVAGVSPAVPG